MRNVTENCDSRATAATTATTADVAALRNSHEAHIASLKEAHSKEVAALMTYVHVLEGQRRPSLGESQHCRFGSGRICSIVNKPLAQDTLVTLNISSSPLQTSRETFTTPAVTTDISDSAQETPSELLKDSASEMERIRRRLSFTPKGSTPTERPNLENDRLRQVDHLQSQVEALTSQLKKSRQSERAMCTVVNSLKGKLDVAQMQINKDEALLEEANTRRIDLLEANSDIEELRRKYVQSQHREWELVKENELLRRRPDQSDI